MNFNILENEFIILENEFLILENEFVIFGKCQYFLLMLEIYFINFRNSFSNIKNRPIFLI